MAGDDEGMKLRDLFRRRPQPSDVEKLGRHMQQLVREAHRGKCGRTVDRMSRLYAWIRAEADDDVVRAGYWEALTASGGAT